MATCPIPGQTATSHGLLSFNSSAMFGSPLPPCRLTCDHGIPVGFPQEPCRLMSGNGWCGALDAGPPINVRTKTKPDRCSPEYLALLRAFPSRPIRGDHAHRRAVGVVNGLLDRPALTADEADYLDVL